MGQEKVKALDDVSLDIFQGEVCCILGPSGSGKSTLLNMIAGLEKPTKGTIHMQGQLVSQMTEKQLAKFRQEHIGFIFQSYNLLPTLTAMENVALPQMFRKVKKEKREKEALSVLKAVGLKKYVLHKPTQMSGGQQQRVGIARAFVGSPSIIFADEPTGNLDTKTTVEVLGIMLKMVRDRNQCLIMVTHDREVAEFADKVIYIRDGNVEKIEINDTRGYVQDAQETS